MVTTAGAIPRRADALKNIAAILDAATTALARDPEASITGIAIAAGVSRVTLYAHFASRAELVARVVDRAMRSSDRELDAVDLEGSAEVALGRLLEASWDVTHRYGGLVLAAQAALSDRDLHQAHEKPTRRMLKLLRRGRREGTLRKDMPLEWQLSAIQGILHAASGAVHRGDLRADHAPALVRTTLLAALSARHDEDAHAPGAATAREIAT